MTQAPRLKECASLAHAKMVGGSPRAQAAFPPPSIWLCEQENPSFPPQNEILIGRTWEFDSATGLKALRRQKGGFRASQLYRYVGSEELVESNRPQIQ